MHFLRKTAWMTFLWAGCTALQAAPLDAASSQRAVQAYCQTIAAAGGLDELEKHWSASFKRRQAALQAEQLEPLDAAARASLQKVVMGMLKDMARKMPPQMDITCTASRCTLVAQLPSQWQQTFVLVREQGVLVIDDAHTHFGAARPAR